MICKEYPLLMAPQLISFRTVGLVLPFNSLWQYRNSQCSVTKAHQQLQTESDGHLYCCRLTTEWHHGCISLQVLQALTNNILSDITKLCNLVLSNNCRLSLQWILAQCWIPGNEQTYTLANQGAKTEQPGAIVTYQEKAIITKALMMPSQENDAYHLLSRQERVILVRLRTRNNQRNAHMHKTLTMVPSAACLFGEEDWQTPKL